MTTVAEVRLWGSTIGAVSLQENARTAVFEYDARFARSGVEVSPIAMPLRTAPYAFPALAAESFHGLPGLLADSLPDRFGSALIDAWLASQGRTPQDFDVVERLCYIGSRGMGALEFAPALGPRNRTSSALHVDALVSLASEILEHRSNWKRSLGESERSAALKEILLVGTSAGGARAKAVIAWNSETNEVRSGQVTAPEGFGYWLLKFDGVTGNRDKELHDPHGFGAIELAYSRMAAAAGIVVPECRLLEEGNRRHFMTRRFDRLSDGGKLHMQSLAGLAHLDFNAAGAHSYEQALFVIRQLALPMRTVEEQFRRMAFNIVARNQDDHVKNIAFLMNRNGGWSLSPAFDLTYSYNPTGRWTSRHQMSLNAKVDAFAMEDFRAAARGAGMKRGRAETIVEEVREVVSRWQRFAKDAGVPPAMAKEVQGQLRLSFPER